MIQLKQEGGKKDKISKFAVILWAILVESS